MKREGERPPSGELAALAALCDCARAIGFRDTLDELLDEVLARAQRLIGFEHCALMLYEPESGRLTVKRARGYGGRDSAVLGLTLERGQGLSGWAAEHRQAVRVGEVSEDSRYVAGLPQARSNLVVPLIVENQVTGVLNVESERPDAFTEEHEKLLTILGVQAALAIVAQRAQQDLTQRIEQLNALYRISQLAAEEDELGATLHAMLEILRGLIPDSQCAILLLDPDRRRLRVEAAYGYAAGVMGLDIPLESGVTGRCARTGEMVRVDDLEREPAYIPGVKGARSEIAVPLIADGRVIGVLNAESTRPDAFAQVHVPTFGVVARQAAAVIRAAQLREETRRLADTDPLTGLFNRRHFSHQLESAVSRAARYGEPLALLMLDLDDLKAINDRFGHHAGDSALQLVADALRAAVRESDETARIGGDEFAVLLLHADREVALEIAERLRSSIELGVVPVGNGATRRLSASIGVALFPEHGAGAEDLLRNADLALYAAKAVRNRVEVAHSRGAQSGADR